MNTFSKIFILVLLAALMFFVIRGIDLFFFDKGMIIFSVTIYYFISGVIAILGFFWGHFWTSIQNPWNLSNFIHRVENEETLDYILMLVQRKKDFFKERKKK